MLSFKEIIRQDNKNVFLNLKEFGELHNVGGKDLLVVIDENEQIERDKRYKNALAEGLFKKQFLFYVMLEDIGFIPAPGRMLIFDGKPYTVTDSTNEEGVLSISMEANRS